MSVIETKSGRFHTFGGKIPDDIHQLCLKHGINKSRVAAKAIVSEALRQEKGA